MFSAMNGPVIPIPVNPVGTGESINKFWWNSKIRA